MDHTLKKGLFFNKIVSVCLCAVCIYIAALCTENFAKSGDLLFILPSLLIIGLFIFLLLKLKAIKLSSVQFGILIFIFALILKGIFAAAVETEPMLDFARHLEAAQRIAAGETSAMDDYQVYQIWSFQSFFVLWEALCIKLFGAGVMFFKLSNALFSAISTLLIFLIVRRFASERAARAVSLIHIFFPASFILVPVLTNQHISELFMLAAIYCFTSEKKCLWLFSGLFLALSNLMRPAGIVMLASVFVLLFMYFITAVRSRDFSLFKVILIKIAVLTVSYLLIVYLAGIFVKGMGFNSNGLGNVYPQWKFILGFNQSTTGQWSKEDFEFVYGTAATESDVNALLNERLGISILSMLKLFLNKCRIMWGSYDTWSWTLQHWQGSTINLGFLGEYSSISIAEAVIKLGSGIYLALNLIIALGAFSTFKKGSENFALMLLSLMVLCYFGVQLFVEIQVRYRSLMYILCFPLAAAGVDALLEIINGKKGRHSQQKKKLPD